MELQDGYEYRIGRNGSALPAIVIGKLPERRSWWMSLDLGGVIVALAPFHDIERAETARNALAWLIGLEALEWPPTLEQAQDALNDLIGLSRPSEAQESALESEAAP